MAVARLFLGPAHGQVLPLGSEGATSAPNYIRRSVGHAIELEHLARPYRQVLSAEEHCYVKSWEQDGQVFYCWGGRYVLR